VCVCVFVLLFPPSDHNLNTLLHKHTNTGEMVFQLPRFDAPLFPPLLRELDAAVEATTAVAETGNAALQGM
jgi:hypothetical protein